MTVIWQNSYSALSYSGFLEVVVLPRKGKWISSKNFQMKSWSVAGGENALNAVHYRQRCMVLVVRNQVKN